MNDAEKKKTMPVCQSWQLNKPLEGDLKTQFQNLFTGEQAWRTSFKGRSPAKWLKDSLGIDLENPTLRDAVAVDLVKLDDKSTSNDYISTTSEHMCWSCSEHERWMLNRNFRIHLVNLENGWSSVKYSTNGSETVKRTVEREYQGPRMSRTLLQYFQDLFNHYFSDSSEEVYVPFTNANDFINEIALIPNTHPDFRSISSRAYYDMKWVKYKRLLGKFGISAVATFALVDYGRDKTHTGEWLVKVQRKAGSGWQYIVAKIDVEGQVKEIMSHWQSERNEILSVCEDDFKKGRASSERPVDGVEFGEREVPMVHSTTSSHYSVFRQRIPEYDLREVRHYLQFKTRLEGMELMLKILKRNVHLKEVQASDCFARETMCISRLFEEFKRNEPLMELVMQYYDHLHQYDEAYEKLIQLRQARASKQDEINHLVQQYNALGSNVEAHRPDRNLDRKLDLGGKIRSLRLEIDKTLHDAILALQDRLVDIEGQVQDLNRRIDLMAQGESQEQEVQNFLDDLQTVFAEDGKWAEAEKEIIKKSQEMKSDVLPMNGEPQPPQSYEDRSRNMHFIDVVARHIHDWMHMRADDDIQLIQPEMDEDDERHIPELVSIDTSRLHQLVLLTERWKGRMLSMGYELHQLNQMLTMCEDATIKVRRLVHNFKERMERTEEDVWDESHQLRPDFNFKAISAASLKDIILLHDWHACNAPQKTYGEMGFSSEDEFMQFRRRCNTISYNLRKNQYAQLLAVDRHRLENAIMDIQDKMRDADSLHWKDKYGWEAKKERDAQEKKSEKWSVEDASSESVKRVYDIVQEDGKVQIPSNGIAATQKVNERFSIFARAEAAIKQKEMDERQYRKDAELMRSRTLAYLKDVGVAEGEEELERLATMNRTAQFKGDVNAEMRKVEDAKRELDKAKGRMERQRNALKDIISQTTDAERKVQSLEMENGRIFDICVRERSRLARNRLLLKKIENETKIAEIRATVKEMKKGRLSDFSDLERLRRDVDRAQAEYDKRVKEFKQTIGSDKDAIESMIAGIYNRFQNEILNGGRK